MRNEQSLYIEDKTCQQLRQYQIPNAFDRGLKKMDEYQQDPAAVFATPDFWKSSKWLHNLNANTNTRDAFFSSV
jgi:hypothetical protein